MSVYNTHSRARSIAVFTCIIIGVLHYNNTYECLLEYDAILHHCWFSCRGSKSQNTPVTHSSSSGTVVVAVIETQRVARGTVTARQPSTDLNDL